MKTKKIKREANKFSLDKFEVAKLKNMHLIIGGGENQDDPPIDDTKGKGKDSSIQCGK
ncbi:hypothetical protein [Flavobacterium sp. LC2016-12]|uniref:hypothetical protein n=1 Tax=Flavobacterium sp. LC2016-12 TaxID=2783794 RepID=UPI00188A3CFA|nr:hypothetical protein [Flavobacterium sp. LC2016-12]MBF4466839.1 hypothetical protein [Flavobacterium sp. LC2016-12]